MRVSFFLPSLFMDTAAPTIAPVVERPPAAPTVDAAPSRPTKAKKKGRPRAGKTAKKAEHQELVLEAARTLVRIIEGHGLPCAVFGSLSSKLYGSARAPKDVDLLICQNPSVSLFKPAQANRTPAQQFLHKRGPHNLLSAHDLKNLILLSDSRHFFLKLPRDPNAGYYKLYYRREYLGVECKVDILTPGTMYLPSLTKKKISKIDGIPVVPFGVLLLHKLQGWDDHRKAEAKHLFVRREQDAGDVKKLLALNKHVESVIGPSDSPESKAKGKGKQGKGNGKGKGKDDDPKDEPDTSNVDGEEKKWWQDESVFSEEFQELSRARVWDFCLEFPGVIATWKKLGFEVPDPGDVERYAAGQSAGDAVAQISARPPTTAEKDRAMQNDEDDDEDEGEDEDEDVAEGEGVDIGDPGDQGEVLEALVPSFFRLTT